MITEALQSALFTRLSTDTALVVLLSQQWGVPAIFSDVPEINGGDDAYFPYVSFGPEIASPWDTKTSFGASVSVQVDVWTREADFVQCKARLSVIHERLHDQQLTIAGAAHVYTQVTSATTSLDPDGRTRRGLMLMTIVYDDIGATPPPSGGGDGPGPGPGGGGGGGGGPGPGGGGGN